VLTVLHAAVESVTAGADASDDLFALAELSFLHGQAAHRGPSERRQRIAHYLAAGESVLSMCVSRSIGQTQVQPRRVR
jgi:tetrahydromethanopterin S-methyltransferase subunit C